LDRAGGISSIPGPPAIASVITIGIPIVPGIVVPGIIVAIPGVIISIPGIIPWVMPIGIVPPRVVPPAGIPGQALPAPLILEPVAGLEVAVITGAVEVVAEVELEGVVITVAVAIPVLVGIIPVFGCLFYLCLCQAGWGLLVWSRRRSERFPVGDSGGYALGGIGPVIARKAGIIPL